MRPACAHTCGPLAVQSQPRMYPTCGLMFVLHAARLWLHMRPACSYTRVPLRYIATYLHVQPYYLFHAAYCLKEWPQRIHVMISSKSNIYKSWLASSNTSWSPDLHRHNDPINFCINSLCHLISINVKSRKCHTWPLIISLIYQCVIIHLYYPIITNVRMIITIASSGQNDTNTFTQSKRDKYYFDNNIALDIIYYMSTIHLYSIRLKIRLIIAQTYINNSRL